MDDRDQIKDQRWVAAVVRVSVERQLRRWGIASMGHNDVDDLVNGVLMSFYCTKRTPLALFDPTKSSAKHYVSLLTRRRLTDFVRVHRRRLELDDEQAAAMLLDSRSPDDPEAIALNREAQNHIVDRLAEHASPLDRQIFQSAFVEGLSNPEIAAELQIPTPRVADRMFTLRRRMTDWLEELHIFVQRRKK